jgi:hypothetical protein
MRFFGAAQLKSSGKLQRVGQRRVSEVSKNRNVFILRGLLDPQELLRGLKGSMEWCVPSGGNSFESGNTPTLQLH